MRLTRRGRRLAWALVLLAGLALGWATRDICYTGAGWGSCDRLIERTR